MLSDDLIESIERYYENIPSWIYSCNEEYFDGWAGYEDSNHLAIVSDASGNFFSFDFVSSPYSTFSKDDMQYCINKVTFEEAIEAIDEMEKAIKDFDETFIGF